MYCKSFYSETYLKEKKSLVKHPDIEPVFNYSQHLSYAGKLLLMLSVPSAPSKPHISVVSYSSMPSISAVRWLADTQSKPGHCSAYKDVTQNRSQCLLNSHLPGVSSLYRSLQTLLQWRNSSISVTSPRPKQFCFMAGDEIKRWNKHSLHL